MGLIANQILMEYISRLAGKAGKKRRKEMQYVYEMPKDLLSETTKKGTVQKFEYDTFTYDEAESKPLHKSAWVYLPYGYDDSKKYDILYLLHGGGVTEDWWFVTFPDTVTILDNMIEKKLCKPCVIVTPTYYRQDETDKNGEYVTENFAKELRRDLIPAVESHYAVYARGDVSEKNLIAVRDHRAIAGLSLGSMTTYRAGLYNNYDLFAWYGPFSGCGGPKADREKEAARICESIKKGYAKNLLLKFMFCANGDADIAYEEHRDIMAKALADCPVLKPGENFDFYIIPGGVHDMKAWQLHLLHALQIFFC